jgi:hypothetical protein
VSMDKGKYCNKKKKKKAYEIECRIYWDMLLLSATYIFSNTLLWMLTPCVDKIIWDHQSRFHRLTTDKIFCLCRILQKNGCAIGQYISYL